MPIPVFWLIPIILLPGVALLILSTATRYGQIHSELHHLQEVDEPITAVFQHHLGQRALLFRNALVSLYISVAAFALGSLAGALLDGLQLPSTWAITLFSIIGVLGLIFATIELIRESSLSFRAIEHHLTHLKIIEDVQKES